MKGHVIPMGGVEGVQETVDDLQAEMAASQEMQDAIFRGLAGLPPMNTIVEGGEDNELNEDSLVRELNVLLGETEDVGTLDNLIGGMPEVPISSVLEGEQQQPQAAASQQGVAILEV